MNVGTCIVGGGGDVSGSFDVGGSFDDTRLLWLLHIAVNLNPTLFYQIM